MRSRLGIRLARALLAAGLAVGPAHASAAPPAAPVVDPAALTLDEATTLALDHAPKLAEARTKVALAQLDVQATRWWAWLVPTVTAHQGSDFLAGLKPFRRPKPEVARQIIAEACWATLAALTGEGPPRA